MTLLDMVRPPAPPPAADPSRCLGCGGPIAAEDGAGYWEPVDGILSMTVGRGPFCSLTCGWEEDAA